eukprot:Rmarinus@m.1772
MSKNRNFPRQLSIDHVSPATRLLERRRQMFEVQQQLEHQKEEFARKEEMFKRREEGLKKKDLELQESLIKFSKFLQENDQKRARALKKANEEIKLRKQKEDDIENLKAQLEELKHQRVQMSNLVSKNLRYSKYLDRVVEHAEEYPEVTDLLMRYATLKATNSDLMKQSRRSVEEQEEQRLALQKYVKERSDDILEYNNYIASLQKRLEEVQNNAIELQTRTDKQLLEQAQNARDMGRIRMACANLFQRILDTSSIKRFPEEETKEQLKVLGEYMADLQQILKQWKQDQRTAPKPQAQPTASLGAAVSNTAGEKDV